MTATADQGKTPPAPTRFSRRRAPTVTLLPDGAAGRRIAHVELGVAAPRTDPLYDAIDRRHTNRGPYAPSPVPPIALAALGDPDPPDGLSLHWIAAGDRFWLNATRDVHTATAAACGVITTSAPDDRRVQLAAGRLVQRIHLRATAAGIALHHMNQITERIDREAAVAVPATFAPRFAALLPAGARPLLTFRVGHPVRDGRPTPRRSVAMVTR
jgi:hypothetical protein